jgi:nucleoside-diphosphate-sugar epimerase
MRVLILGAGGFLGVRLARQLAIVARLGMQPIDELVLSDLRPVPAPTGAACKIVPVHGDLRDGGLLDSLFARPPDAIFHLAATLTVDAEADFRRGLETNLLALIELLERCRRQPTAPLLLFASSIATFGGTLPPVVDDEVRQAPSTSYGTHKAVTELLLADYSRHGFVDGRALRLPIVVTHPGPPSGSISDQVASLIREPLRGQRTTCRMAPDSALAMASVDKVVEGFLRLATLPAETIAEHRTMNLPGLSATPAQIVQAVARRLSGGIDDLIAWQPDAQVQRIIDGWPAGFTSERALALGFRPDDSADALVEAFLAAEEAQP